MEEILSMIKNGECDLTHLTNGDYCFNDVYQDKGYMASVGSWAIGEGTDTYELEYGTDFEYVRVPQYGDQMSFASETGWGLIVPENGKNKDAAWEFISFFSEPENLVEHNIACSQLPPRKSLLEQRRHTLRGDAARRSSFWTSCLTDSGWGHTILPHMREVFKSDMFTEPLSRKRTRMWRLRSARGFPADYIRM